MKKVLWILLAMSTTAFAQETGRHDNALRWDITHTLKPATEQEALFRKMNKAFKNKNLDVQKYSIGIKYAREKMPKKAVTFVRAINDLKIRYLAIKQVVLESDSVDLPVVEKLLLKEMKMAAKRVQNPSSYYELSAIYGTILMSKGDVFKALTYVEPAYLNLDKNDQELSLNYHYLLSRNGRYQEAFDYMEKVVKSGYAEDKIKRELREAFFNLNPEHDPDLYMEGLKQNLNSEMKAYVDKFETHKIAPDFKVIDVHGNPVRLADYKGKIVVIDFWATWCGPCVKALPAMQKVVDKYETDPAVKFMFIHTLENKPNPLIAAKDYFAKHNYRLPLFIDAIDPETKTNPAYAAFGYKGIPTKLVIDGKGIIRYKITGFDNGDDKAVEEISVMIEKVR